MDIYSILLTQLLHTLMGLKPHMSVILDLFSKELLLEPVELIVSLMEINPLVKVSCIANYMLDGYEGMA